MASIDWVNNPPTCEDCGATIRPHHTSKKEYPGTRPYGGKGICNSCCRRRRESNPSRSTIDWGVDQLCAACGTKMRPSRASIKEWPNTRPYASKGRCSSCIKEGRTGYPTARELFEQGHPCVELAPLPSNKRSLPW